MPLLKFQPSYVAVPYQLGNCWMQYNNPLQHSHCQLFPNGYDSELLGIIGRSTSVLIIVHTIFTCCIQQSSGFGGLGVACWPLVPKFAGSNAAEAVEFLRAKKILSTPSFGAEVKPSVPCRRFAACKRSLNGVEDGKITGQHSRPQFHLPLLGSLALWRTWRHLVAKVGTSKHGGKQWQTTPRTCPGCSVPELYQSTD